MRVACGIDSLRSPAPWRGGEPERLPSPAKVSIQVSEGREFVATLKVDVCDLSSQVFNHTHANQTIDMSGAVLKLVSMLRVCTPGTEVPACSPQPRNQRNQTAARSLPITGVVRFARLCVLIEPNPVRRSVTRTLAGFCTLINTVRRALLSNPPNLVDAALSNSGDRASISDDAVCTYKLCSCGPESRRSPRGCCRAILLPVSLDRLTFQFTNRRMRTFMTTPSARKVNNTEDPP